MQDEYQFSELPALELFREMGYTYLSGKDLVEKTDPTEVLLKDRLLQAIQRINPWLSDDNRHRAYETLTTVPGASLIEINQKVWELIRGPELSVKQKFGETEEFRAVSFIDYTHPENNDFLIVNQPRYLNRVGRLSIPDLVVYLNGLPVAVLECKSPTAATAWDSAFCDLEAYQNLNERLFHYNQICAGLWRVGARYGAIGSGQAFYSVFRTRPHEDPPFIHTEQDRLVYNLFRPERLLDIIRHFVLFENEEGRMVKKLPRYQQIRATNRTIAKLQTGQGGVVWHTQGSGKSLTMATSRASCKPPNSGSTTPPSS